METADPLLSGVRTPRLLLAAPRAGDGAALLAAIIASQHELEPFPAGLPWSGWPPSLTQVEDYCRLVAADWQQCRVALLWRQQEVVGWMALQLAPSAAQLRFWGHSDWQGQGLFAEAVEQMLLLAFGPYRLRRIQVPLYGEQRAAQRLCRRLGMLLQPGGADDAPASYTLALH